MAYSQVVRVYATTQAPDYDCPWQARPPERGTGSGVVIAGDKILTGAHVVANATFVQVQKPSEPDKAIARVTAVCHDCDLALLEVDQPGFLDDVEPADIGTLPALRDKVSVVGFPIGGEEISITEGVVSRIEVQRYNHSQRYLLAVTVDAAINQGNSGGPVFRNGKIAGIAFQKLPGADNIGEMVPAPIIHTFLRGVEAGKTPQVPGLGIITQPLENPFLRQQLGLARGESGVLIVDVEHGSSAWGVIQSRDVLTEIDGLRIANNGTVQYQERYRTRYDVTLGRYFVGDTLPLTILRDGEHTAVEVTLQPMHYLVPRAQYDIAPPYFIYGGLVFQPLTRDYLATWSKWWNKAPKEFLHYYYSGIRSAKQREIVILSQVLGDEINVGYGDCYNESVTLVNGVCPIDMADFVTRIQASQGTVEITMSGPSAIMFDTEEVRAAMPRILGRYHIEFDRSRDLAGAS
ncbi:MAG: serine protease [Proteobacteria bacterium]|nr:serine protease [Pseudomonadota bacterium]